MAERCGLLLVNVGTPSDPSVKGVRQYLREFLTDRRMIDLPTVLRYALVWGVIAPLRGPKSAKAYQAVWSHEHGSPLLHYSQQCVQKLQDTLGDRIPVALGMRYGQPSIQQAIDTLMAQQCERIIVFPMFPQYASATTGSAVEMVTKQLARYKNIPAITSILDYFDHPSYIAALSSLIVPYLNTVPFDKLLLSYHGLPLKQIEQSESMTPKACYQGLPCPDMGVQNRFCYRAQCFATSRSLANACGIESDRIETVFQSRLGPLAWIEPSFTGKLRDLAGQGVKRLLVACPSFTTDCLETLEEINMAGKKQWQELGGERFEFVPCLNDNDMWIQAITSIAAEHNAIFEKNSREKVLNVA